MKLRIDNYVINPGKFIAGTRGSYGIEQIELEFSEEWDGLSVTVSFYPAVGDPVNLLYTGQPFFIPSEVMNVSGSCKYVVSGYRDTKRLISAEGVLRVINTSTPTDNPALEPTPDLFSQIMTLAGTLSDIDDNRKKNYAPQSGTCPDLTVGAAYSLSGDSVVTRETILSESEVAGGDTPVALYSGKLHTISGMTILQRLENGNFVDSSGWTAQAGTLQCENYTAELTIDPEGAREGGRSRFVELKLTAGTDYTYPDPDVLTKYYVTSSDTDVATVSANGSSLVVTPIAGGVTTLHFEPLEGVYTAPALDILASVGGATSSVSTMPYPGIETPFDVVSMEPYYISAQIKAPAGAELKLGLGGNNAIPFDVPDTGEWQTIGGIVGLSNTASTVLRIWDSRRAKASCTVTGGYYLTARANNISRLLAIAGAHTAGTTTLTFTCTESGWVLSFPDTRTMNVSPENCGLSLTVNPSTTSDMVGSVITVAVVNPFNTSGVATVSVSSDAGLSDVTVDGDVFAGGVEGAGSGSYTLKYVSGAWRCQGRQVFLDMMGISANSTGTPAEGATITVALTVPEEKFYVRNVQIGLIDPVGLGSFNALKLAQIYGNGYHQPGLTHASIAGIRCLDADGNVIDGGMYFDEPIVLRRMPDGTADTLDLDAGVLTRRVGVQTITGETGDLVALAMAQKDTSCLSDYDSVGTVSGGLLRLSRPLAGDKVYYLLSSPQESEVSLPDTFRVCAGGTEQLITIEDGNYVVASLGAPVKLSYSMDVWRQCRSDSEKITALMVALGLSTTSDSNIAALSSEMSAALAAL